MSEQLQLALIEQLKNALKDCLHSMEMQERREQGLFHISAPAARHIWDRSKKRARALLGLPSEE